MSIFAFLSEDEVDSIAGANKKLNDYSGVQGRYRPAEQCSCQQLANISLG